MNSAEPDRRSPLRLALALVALLVLAAALLALGDAVDRPAVALVGAVVIGGLMLAREWWLGTFWVWGALLSTAAVAGVVSVLVTRL